MTKNCLIFGGGSKFGLDLSTKLSNMGHNLYIVTSTPAGRPQETLINWHKCDFIFIEKFLSNLPIIDVVIFNQNFSQTPESVDLRIEKPHLWKQGKDWIQAHFVNSVLPCQVLTTLVLDGKFTENSLSAWMLSGVIWQNKVDGLLGYQHQKQLNRDIIKSISKNNKGRFIGIDPGLLDDSTRNQKAQVLAGFLDNGYQGNLFYQFNDDHTAIIPHMHVG